MQFINSSQIKTALSVYDITLAFAAPFLAWLARNFFVGYQPIPAGFYFYSTAATIATLVTLQLGGVTRVHWRFFSFPDARSAFVNITIGIILAAGAAFLIDRLENVPRSLLFLHVLIQF